MSWFADIAGKAENLLNNLDEQTGAALRNHNKKPKLEFNSETNWSPKKKSIKGVKKSSTGDAKSFSGNIPSRRSSPTYQPRQSAKEITEIRTTPKKNIPIRKNPQFNLNHCPKTLVADVQGDSEYLDQNGKKPRRHSLPSDLDTVGGEGWILRMQNLEVENAMLKNELNVLNKEVSDLLERLKKAEDGNNVVSEDAHRTHVRLDSAELDNHRMNLDKELLMSQVEQLKMKINEVTVKKDHYYVEKHRLHKEVITLAECKKDFEEKIEHLKKQNQDLSANQQKLETELRHAQSNITELQSHLEKSNTECQRLERDWESYKLRVKNMLSAKDNEIKSLQEGLSFAEDTKILMDQLETLKDERDELSQGIANVRNECENMKNYMSQLEARNEKAEHVISALRDALKEERGARNRAESQCVVIAKDLKTFQLETGQTIANLRTALRDKENELNHLRDTTSSIKTADTSALNVAEYTVTQDTDNEKIEALTETLIQRQGKIDRLLADNNMLRIQLDKLESKYKAEISNRTSNHSIVNLQTDCRQRRHTSSSTINTISHWMAAGIKRYPAFRIFIVVYMVLLHVWVFTVLLTNTPDTYIPRPVRSS